MARTIESLELAAANAATLCRYTTEYGEAATKLPVHVAPAMGARHWEPVKAVFARALDRLRRGEK